MSEELQERIHDLLKINVEHQNLNADLRKEVKYLKDRLEFYLIQLDTLKSENRSLRSCLLYTSPSPRDGLLSRMPSSA